MPIACFDLDSDSILLHMSRAEAENLARTSNVLAVITSAADAGHPGESPLPQTLLDLAAAIHQAVGAQK